MKQMMAAADRLLQLQLQDLRGAHVPARQECKEFVELQRPTLGVCVGVGGGDSGSID
jgi:hypothetical protein